MPIKLVKKRNIKLTINNKNPAPPIPSKIFFMFLPHNPKKYQSSNRQ